MKKLALLGASGHGKVVADVARCAGWDHIAFFDITWPQTSKNGVWPVIGDMASLLENISDFDGIVVAIGDCAIRFREQNKISKAGGIVATLIHPSAIISPSATLGKGCVVMPNAIINADAQIGEGGIINSGAIVEHDCQLGHYVHIAPGVVLSGNVSVGNLSWIGVGATARQGAFIGQEVMVGAGAVVINEIKDGLTVVGCPAAPLYKKT